MADKFTDVGGTLEAAWDGISRVVLRQKFTKGPNFHLTRELVEKLLELFVARPDEYVPRKFEP